MFKRFFHYILITDLIFLLIGFLFYGIRIGGSVIEAFFSLLILIVVLVMPSIPVAIGFLIAEILSVYTADRLRQIYRKIPSHGKTKKLLRRVLSLILTDEEQEGICGDLREEYAQFESKAEGRIWLCRQIIKSIPPLAYKNLKSRLASYFEERIR